ncbi:hypothetical protein V2J09_017106 [Rumex salicifolius]
MAVESSFSALLQNLKLDDPWLPPKPWEYIPSQSGLVSSASFPNSSSSNPSFYDLSSVSEASLVRLVMYALQGCQSSLVSIEKISESFCSDPADRSANRIPSLWTRSLSTNALGKMLKSIGSTGSVVLLLHKFVEYFTSSNFDSISIETKEDKEHTSQIENTENENVEAHPARSLVNQAFAVAVGKVLKGYISAVSTVNTSALLRRSRNKVSLLPKASLELGNLTSVVHCELTLLEVYLHTEEMRTQIEALGNICGLHETISWFSLASLKDPVTKAAEVFYKFPRGGDLLTYLYHELLVADPVHRALLKFLFHRSLEPYCSFIRSWIYEAKITDPYGEFTIEYEENLTPYSHGEAGMPVDFPFATIRVRDGVSVPSFLKDFIVPLLRAGQQLKVILKLLEFCKHITTGEHTFEDVLPGCGGLSISDFVYASTLSFNKKEIEDRVISRKKFYRNLLEKLEHVMKNFEIRYYQATLHYAPRAISNSGGSLDTQPSFTNDERLNFSATGERDLNGISQDEDSDDSSMVDDLSNPLESSECSSEEQNDLLQSTELLEDSFTPKKNYMSALSFSSISIGGGCTQELFPTKKAHHMGHDFSKISETSKISSPHLDHCQNRIIARGYSDSFGDLSTSKPWINKMQYADQGPGLGWPLGGLQKNPLDKWMSTMDARLQNSGCRQDPSTRDFDISEDKASTNVLPNCFSSVNGFHDEVLANANSSSNSYVLQSWNAKMPNNLLSMNPMLTKNKFQNLVGKTESLETSKISKIFPYFEFLSAEDPLHLHRRWFSSIPEDQSKVASSVSSTVQPEECSLLKDVTAIKEKTLSNDLLNSKDSSAQSIDAKLKDARGGSAWASLLHTRRVRSTNEANQNNGCTSDALFEIPLDFIISKCILQEILYQLTIKLLEEGFALQEHLLTLCRYHFMEISDWADLFIRSLWHHKWCFIEADQRIGEIQGLLKSSIQRSSCEQDLNKDRLYIYVKDFSVASLPSFSTGVHSFNFIGLGYRVEWPISIILNPSALRIYAEIFSFLIQVKLAAQSLTDLWCLMKDFGHIYSQRSKQHGVSWSNYNRLIKLRQQYVLSQLSDVSWCRFVHSLKHQVKDMIDLESVHISYLSDSLRICFLSDETKSTSNTIQGILQCALDFHCFLVKDTKADDHNTDRGTLFQINNSQILSIKKKFEESMKDLHSQYLKSPKHGEFSLSRFWSCLNYNEYYSNTIDREIPFYALSF